MSAPVFRILVICSGNVCRSPLTERLLRKRMGDVFGPDEYRLVVTSAGTSAMVGASMDPRAAAVGEALGASSAGFVARGLGVQDVATADLVLGAAREHRAAAVRLHPAAHRYAFTVREFSRLCLEVDPAALPEGDFVERARALVAAAVTRRGVSRPRRAEDDDVPDPHGGQDRVHREVGAVLEQSVAVVTAVLAGLTLEPAASTVPANRPRGGAERRADRRAERRESVRADSPGAAPTADGYGSRRTSHRRQTRSGPAGGPGRGGGGRRVRRVLLRGGLGVFALVLLSAGWVALRGMQAQRELVAARADVASVRTALLAGDLRAARVALTDAQGRTGRARDLTGDPVWRVAAATPYAGANPAAVRTVATAVDDLARGALPALVQAGAALDPAQLRPAGDRVSLGAFAAATPVLGSARTDMVATRDKLDALDGGPLLPQVAGAVRDLRIELTDTTRALDGVGRASRLVPVMLGDGTTRRYLVVFQNNAEARATGGLVGAYAIVTARAGRLKVAKIGSNTDLRSADTVPVNLGRDFRAVWGDAPALWNNGNLDANFPNAARIWLALWHKQTGQHLDGVLATDPVALGYLLAATGPVRLDSGESIDAGNATRLTMRDVYARSDDNAVRDGFLRSVAGSVVEALVAGKGSPRAVLDQLSRAASERRLLLYSSHAGEQKDIRPTVLSGILSGLPGPYAFVAVNNAGGNKMDYYLQRSIRYDAGRCSDGRRNSRLTVTLGNTAPNPARLPVYVSQRLDDATGTQSQSSSEGAVVALVSVYGPLEGGVVRATLDGKPMPVSSGRSAQRPVWTFPVVIGHGGRRTVVLELLEPASDGTPTVPVQPLVLPAKVTTSTASCS